MSLLRVHADWSLYRNACFGYSHVSIMAGLCNTPSCCCAYRRHHPAVSGDLFT